MADKDLQLTNEEKEVLQQLANDPSAKLVFLKKLKKIIADYNNHIKGDLEGIKKLRNKIIGLK